MSMLMFRDGQFVQIKIGSLVGKNGIVRMIEADGSAWVVMKGGEELTKQVNAEYTVRGACVLLWPEDCNPL